MGRADRRPSDHVPNLDDGEESEGHLEVLHSASFVELASENVQYYMLMWFSISLLLVLAWGIGIIMLLYMPFRKYVLQKDIESRKLYITSKEIVYEVTRPSFIPFLGEVKIRKHIPLSLVIDIIIEQGWLQSIYGLHTFRIESIAFGKAAPVDEFHVQGVSDPGLLRKIIIAQASKAILEHARTWNPSLYVSRVESMSNLESLTLGPAVLRSPTPHKSRKRLGSPFLPFEEAKGVVPAELMLQKLEEVNRSIKKIEFFMDKGLGTNLENVQARTPHPGLDLEAEAELFETPKVQL